MRRAGGPSPLELFRNPDFRALWAGQLVSVFGDRFTYLALLALVVEHARDRANPAGELALIPLASFLPAILFGPWVGALVDGWNTRRVLILSDAARGVIVLLLIPAAHLGGLPAAFAVVFLLYLANAFFLPARSAILPDLVPAARLTEANSLATLAGVAATIAGAVLGGLVVGRFGWRVGFALDSATYFVSAAALAMIRPTHRTPAPPRGAEGAAEAAWEPAVPHGAPAPPGPYRRLWADVREGAGIALKSGAALGSIAAVALLWIAGGALHVALPLHLERRGAGMIPGVGAALAAAALGMVVGTVALAARGGRGRARPRIAWGLAGTGVSIALLSASRALATDLAAALAAGAFAAVLLVTTESAIQEAVAASARGRVFALRDFTARLLVLIAAGVSGAAIAKGWTTPAGTTIAAGALLFLGGGALAAAGSRPRDGERERRRG